MNMLNEMVLHKNYGQGVIRNFSEKCIEVEFEDGTLKKFQFPQAFDQYLSFANYQLQSTVSAINKDTSGNNKKENITENDQCPPFNKSQDLDSYDLSIGDSFDYIVNVMNECFGWNYKACMRGFYFLDSGHKFGAWFPKIAIVEGGVTKSTDKFHGWINSMTADENYIYMYNEDISRMNSVESDTQSPYHITFVKRPGEKKYVFAGVYIRTALDPVKGFIYKRVGLDFNTETYDFMEI